MVTNYKNNVLVTVFPAGFYLINISYNLDKMGYNTSNKHLLVVKTK